MNIAIGSRWQCRDLQKTQYCCTMEFIRQEGCQFFLRTVEVAPGSAREGAEVGWEFPVDEEWFRRRGVEVSP